MPKLVRMYILQVVTGFGLSALFVALLLWLNVGNLGTLVQSTSGGAIAVAMLFIANGIVFAGVQFAIAVMRMQDTPPPGGGRKDTLPIKTTHLATVTAKAGKTRR